MSSTSRSHIDCLSLVIHTIISNLAQTGRLEYPSQLQNKLIIQHFFGIISLLLLLLDLNLLIDLHFRAFKFLLCFMKSSFHEALGFLFFTVQVSFLEHLMHGLLFGAWFLPFNFVSAIFSLFGIIFIRHFVKPLDLRWVHQLVQLSLVVFLPVHLLSRVIVLDCLCI